MWTEYVILFSVKALGSEHMPFGCEEIKKHPDAGSCQQADHRMVVDERHCADEQAVRAAVKNQPDGADGGEFGELPRCRRSRRMFECEVAIAAPCDRDRKRKRKQPCRDAPQSQRVNAEIKHSGIDDEAASADDAEFEKLPRGGAPVYECVTFCHRGVFLSNKT